MSSRLRQLARKVVHLASGEIPARICGIATVLFLARHSGVVIVGIYALAQGMVQYTLSETTPEQPRADTSAVLNILRKATAFS
jgi:O-antigen/teichoic acid export membrane protein